MIRFWLPVWWSLKSEARDAAYRGRDTGREFVSFLVSLAVLLMYVLGVFISPLTQPFRLAAHHRKDMSDWRSLISDIRANRFGNNAYMTKVLRRRVRIFPRNRVYKAMLRAAENQERAFMRQLEAERADLQKRREA